MCWNADISINTFLFSCLSLIFIYFTNTYTKYKTPAFNNPIVYLFLLEVISIQLLEFFLWRNLKDKKWNEWLSKIVSFIIFLQPITLMTLNPQPVLRNVNILLYIVFIISILIYKDLYNPIVFHTSVGDNGHLLWEWLKYTGHESIIGWIFLCLYVFATINTNIFHLEWFILLSLVISLFFYRTITYASMWCWLANLFFIYFIVNILIIQPFYEYNGLC